MTWGANNLRALLSVNLVGNGFSGFLFSYWWKYKLIKKQAY